jgi:transcription-repair coupling factor (superfamily II helicase)
VSARWLEPLRDAHWLRDLGRQLEQGAVVALAGPIGSARPLLALLASPAPLLVVVPRERDIEDAVLDLSSWAAEVGQPGLVAPFPAPGPSPFRGLPRHPDAALKRATALHAARRGRARALVASPAGLLRPTLAGELFETRTFTLAAGDEMTPEILLEALDDCGYRREDPVTSAGEAARRGGIVDVFPPDQEAPVRIEFFGDQAESLRSFDPETQRSRGAAPRIEIAPLSDAFAPRSLLEKLKRGLAERFAGHAELPGLLERLERGLNPEALPELLPLVPGATVPPWQALDAVAVVALEPEAVLEQAEELHRHATEDRSSRSAALALAVEEALVSVDALRERLERGPALHLREMDLVPGRSQTLVCRPVRRYMGDIQALAAELKTERGRSVIFLGNAGRAERLGERLLEDGLSLGEGAASELRVGALSSGFELPESALRVLSDGDVYPEEVHVHRKRRGARGFLSDLRDLRVGDLIVHQDHGIGRFEGLQTLEIAGATREFMVLSYLGGDKLKVPIEAFDQIQRYSAAEAARPALDRLGSGQWDKVKRRVKKAMRDMAAELLRLYAERKARPGHAFSSDSPWLREFEAGFEFEETPDQGAAIAEVTYDMARPTPMDRLVCGDVGYGKTEVAMRAAMLAVLDAKQVALLTPTTVLAFQHWKTFRKRFAPFPVKIEMLSRFRAPREIKGVLQALSEGKVDVVIGTHRLLSKDVVFRDLGLLVIDEEQRFGVAAKEKLKQLRREVDCLTLSATPIPRTLQMGLAGIRDMSVIETPPKDRLAIQTSIVKFSTETIAAATRQELARDGQVFLVHNRVESIYALASLVQRLVPEARVVVAHGQMPEAELEKTMLAFVEGRADVLVATTIIENGLDIPRVNTIIVNRADRYGLAQLYQLRGRVGRSDRRAYAYLLVPPDTVLSQLAQKRLAAIRDFSELGAGFRIAALDLELRGAGNLLGGQQSGHIEAVGLDLYIKLLEQTIQELRGEPVREGPRCTMNLGVDLRIPADYVPDVQQRMALYKRVSEAKRPEDLERLAGEMRDRYGAPPPEAATLLDYGRLRLRAEALGLAQVERGERVVVLRPGPELAGAPQAIVALVQAVRGAALHPDGAIRLPSASGAEPLLAVAAALDTLERARGASVAASL